MKFKLILLATLIIPVYKDGLAQNKFHQRLDSLMEAYNKLNWNAAVIVAKEGHIIFQKAIGYADVEKKIPLQVDAMMASASVGKMFTSTRIMQLVEQGKLSLQAPVSRYISGWNLKNFDKITLHQLLTHTSGLASTWDNPKYDFTKNYTVAEFKTLSEEVPLIFDIPGKQYFYSNIGYTLLGEVIAKIDGIPYQQSIEKYIFKPIQILPSKDLVATRRLAKPYYQVASDKFIEDQEQKLVIHQAPTGAGGWILGAPELYRFVSAYQQGKYLSKSSMEVQRTANKIFNGLERNYRYGLSLLNLNMNKPIFGHNGGGKGYTADGFFDAESGYTIIMFSNQYGSGYGITSNLFRVLYDKEIIPPAQPAYIRLIEQLYSVGAKNMLEETETFFQKLGISPSGLLLSRTADNLVLAKDYNNAKVITEVGRKLFPTSPTQWLLSGDIALKLNEVDSAMNYYLQAKKLSEQAKDALAFDAAEDKLKKMIK